MTTKEVSECIMTAEDLIEALIECVKVLENNQSSPAQPDIIQTIKHRLMDLSCDFGEWEQAPTLDRLEECGLIEELYAIACEVLK